MGEAHLLALELAWRQAFHLQAFGGVLVLPWRRLADAIFALSLRCRLQGLGQVRAFICVRRPLFLSASLGDTPSLVARLRWPSGLAFWIPQECGNGRDGLW